MNQRINHSFSIPTARIAAAVVAALALLPLGAAVGGHGYGGLVGSWLRGIAIVGIIAALVVMLTRAQPSLWRAPAVGMLIEWYRERPRAAMALIALIAFAAYAVAAQLVFDGHPLNIDELAQVVQARILTSGHLWLPAPVHPEFFGVYHIVDTGGKVYSQFPMGGPAMLALGELVHAAWLVGPLCGAITVAAFAWYLRAAEPRAGVAFGALLLFAFAPFVLFMSATYMNHVPTLMWLMIAIAALAHVTRSRRPDSESSYGVQDASDVHATRSRRPDSESSYGVQDASDVHATRSRRPDSESSYGVQDASDVHATRLRVPQPKLAFVAGLALGCAATIRPLDALAFALPAAIWLLARAIRERARWQDAFAAAGGVALPIALLMWTNVHTTGAPLRFGYEVLWGSAHGLGFHRDPSGEMHTVTRGLAFINLYFLRFQSHLFEAPLPSLLPVIAALALVPKLDTLDRYWLASGALLVASYFAYWFAGDYLGPRFLFPLAPVLALWTARLPALVRDRFGHGLAYRATITIYAVSAIGALAFGIPARVREYEAIGPLERWDAGRATVDAGAHDALVLIRENWGGQLVARLWALGIARSDASFLYRRIDTCVLDQHLADVEQRGLRGSAAHAALTPLMADSAQLIASPYSPRTGERTLPGLDYSPHCRAQIAANESGFLPYQPFIVARGGGNLFARDLGARDTLLLAQHPLAPVFAIRLDLAPGGRGLFVERLSRDSIYAAARVGGGADD